MNPKDSSQDNLRFEFSLGNNLFATFLSIVFAACATFLLTIAIKAGFDGTGFVFLFAPFILICLLATLPLFNHIKHDYNRILIIDKSSQTITIKDSKKEISFNNSKIKECRVFTSKTGYSFTLIKLKYGNQYAVTSFIIDPAELISALEPVVCKSENDLLPLVSKDSL